MLFTKPLLEIAAADVEELCALQYPESDQVEYKQFVPGQDGPDRWHADQSGGISPTGRGKLLQEIVAFANSHGGHLVIGIEESTDKPARATRHHPVPQCADLANRLLQAAFACIEPRIVNLQARGVPSAADGSGSVVVRVPRSLNAPHRLISDRHCYVRRGESTVAMTMREITDLTLNTLRGTEAVLATMKGFRSKFEAAANIGIEPRGTRYLLGLRCSVVPIESLAIPSGAHRQLAEQTRRQFRVTRRSGQVDDAQIPVRGHGLRPVLRGSQVFSQQPRFEFQHTVYWDGSQNLTFVQQRDMDDEQERLGPSPIFLEWALGAAASILNSASEASKLAESPTSEFAIELQLAAQFQHPMLLWGPDNRQRFEFPEPNVVFPTYSHVPELGMTSLFDAKLADLLNAVGIEHGDPVTAVNVI